MRTPRIAPGRLRLLDEVPVFDPERGYLCAETAVSPDDWFFDGHFHNDPCMPAERERLTEPCPDVPALRGEAGPMLTMLDRLTGYWPEGGTAGLGRLRAEKDIDPGDWYFKAHFFQDPVMPGSLGVEALCQLLQWYVTERGIGGARSSPSRSASR